MFKKLAIAFAMLLCCMIPISNNWGENIDVAAAATTLTTDTTYSNEIITIDETISGNYLTVSSGVTLTLDNITFAGSGSVDSLIYVENGGKLVINTLKVTLSNCDYVISNFGECVINGLVVSSTTTYDIYNSSNTCTFENVSIDSLYLNDGYITVNGNTEINNTISVELSSTKETVPSLIVDGDSVFASKFNDKFSYAGDYQVSIRPNPLEEPVTYDTIFDYVGSTDKMTETAKNNVTSLGLTTGDIVLTSKVCFDTNQNYLAPLYATMNSYLKTATVGTYTYSHGQIYDSNGDDGINPSIVADNYNMLAYSKVTSTITQSSAYINLTVDTRFNDALKTTQSIALGTNGSWLVFVDREEGDYIIEKSSNLNVTELYNCATHIALLVEHNGDVASNNASVSVLFTKITEITVIPVAVSGALTYTGEDIFSTLEVVYYYGDAPHSVGVVPMEIVNAGTYTISLYSKDEGFVLSRHTIDIVVEPKEITINYSQTSSEYTGNDIIVTAEPSGVALDDEINLTLTNNVKKEIGTYTVTATIDNDNYVIAEGDETYSFVISKIKINENWESPGAIECTYQAADILPDISNILSASDAIQVDYEYTTIPRNAGEYTVYVNVSLKDTEHYASLSSEKSRFECLVIIYPVMVEPYLTCNSFEYTGAIPTLELKFRYAVGGETVLGELTPLSGCNVNTYQVECSLVDNEINKNYYMYEGDKLLSVSITPATINMGGVTFIDETREFSGEVYVPQVANLPDTVQVSYEYEGYIYTRGEHIITAKFVRKDTHNYSPLTITELSMTLTIVKCRVDVSKVTLIGDNVDYDGNAHGLEPSNMPSNATYAVDKNDYIDAGTYTITFTLLPVSEDYELYGRDSMIISATLVINKIDYVLSGIGFVDKTVTYDADNHTISMTGTLPIGLTTQNTVSFKNAGEHTVRLVFVNSNSNYNTPESLTAILTIEKKELTITLEQNEFTYTGEEFTADYVLSGVEDGDSVEVTLTGHKNILAGNYTAHVSIDENNYILNTEDLPYTIKKATINMSGVTLQSQEIYYFGGVYTPKITGTLPTGIIDVIYTHEEIKNVGEYDVIAAFVVDANYNTPVQLLAIIEILHKPITISFSNHLNLMYNGNTQYITVNVTGMVDNEEYTISYSGEPKEPGEYCCEVVLAYDTNYVAMSDTRCYFDIHTETKSYNGEKYNLTVSNGMFKVDNELSVNKITLSKEVESQIKTMHEEMVFMDSIKIIADHSEEEISVSLELKELNLSKNKAVTLYKLTSDGKLEKVEYNVVGNRITFSSLPNTNYVIVSEKVDNSIMILLIVVAVLFVIVSAFSVIMVIKNKKLKKVKDNK